jgi:group I intron endonuclease
MCVYTIYKATNIVNNKVYIGFTSLTLDERSSRHRANSSNNENTKFYKSIRKYGWNNFIWEIIYQSLNYEHTLNEMERHFIEEYNSYKDGYNSTLGGEGCSGYSYDHTEDHKNYMRTIRIGSKNPFFGKTHTEERNKQWAEKMKPHVTGKNNGNHSSIEYNWFNINTGQIVKMSQFDFYTIYGFNRVGVNNVVKNRRPTVRGWKILRTEE